MKTKKDRSDKNHNIAYNSSVSISILWHNSVHVYTKICKYKNTQGQSGFVLTLPELIMQTGIYKRDREKLLIYH